MAQSRALHPAPCFNTQPPEGGCQLTAKRLSLWRGFQHTAARRRLHGTVQLSDVAGPVSTHSRPKAAAMAALNVAATILSFNTQPPEGGCARSCSGGWGVVGFNTQPPEGGCVDPIRDRAQALVSTHSRPKAAARDSRLKPV